jgi:hypothetical protein
MTRHALQFFASSGFAWPPMSNRKERLAAVAQSLFRLCCCFFFGGNLVCCRGTECLLPSPQLISILQEWPPPHVFNVYLPSILKFLDLRADGESVKNHADDDCMARSVGDEPGDDMDLSSCNNAYSPLSLAHSFVKFLSDNNAVEVAKDDSALDGFFLYRDECLHL